MGATQPKDHWDTVHRERRADEVSWYQRHPTRSLELVDATGIGHDAAIVDVGGGASTLVDHLLDAGYSDVTVLDLSAIGLEQARRRLGARARLVDWVSADVRSWRPDRAYDLWHDRAVLHFLVDPGDRKRYVETLRAALAPGGHAIVATFGPDGPEQCSGLPVVRYDTEDLTVLLGAGFRLVEHRLDDHRTPGGVAQQFLYARFRRDR